MKKIFHLFASPKTKLAACATALLCALSTGTIAAPLVFETETAKVIVVRPLDLWSGDKTTLEESLAGHKEKTVHYKIQTETSVLNGNPALFRSPTDHSVIKEVNQRINSLGFKAPMSSSNAMFIHKPTSIPGLLAKDFVDYQNDVYQLAVKSQGNPDDLQSKTSRNKVLGAALSIGTTLLVGQRYGTDLGANTFLGSGSANDLYKAVANYNSSLAAVEINNVDLSDAKELSIRRVDAFNKLTGQIIIAYKGDKTEAAEHEALVIAVVALTGANSTTAEIEQARKEDFARRKAIWDKCVADGGGTCKPEPIRRGGG